MFVLVKNLTAYMDKTIQTIRDNLTADAPKETIKNINDGLAHRLESQLKKLKEISTNKKLIDKYEKLVKEVIEEEK